MKINGNSAQITIKSAGMVCLVVLLASAMVRAQSSPVVFAPAVTYSSGGYNASSVAVADVNGDGKLDLLVANVISNSTLNAGGVGVLLGNGDGTFQPAVIYGSGLFATSIAVADVNGDGKLDLLVVSTSPSSVYVLLGNGDGTFQAPVAYGTGGYNAISVAVADVNGDGRLDLVVANQCVSSTNCADGTVGVLLGNGDGTFQTAVTYGSGGWGAYSVAAADVNGDGKPDLLVANQCVSSTSCANGTVGVLMGNGDGTFRTVVTYGTGGYASTSVAVADVNGDGKPDLVVANSTPGIIGILLGNGDGTFQKAVPYSSAGVATSVAVADVNGDGKPDLVVANECVGNCNGIAVLPGNGDGTFQTAVQFGSAGFNSDSVAVADVNGDGKPDLLVANLCAVNNCTDHFTVGPGSVSVLINTSVGSTTTALASSSNPSSFNQAVTFTAAVTSQFFKFHPTGTVSFFDGTTNLGNSPLTGSGVAALSIATLAAGTHNITATYNGDTNFAVSTSHIVSQVVQKADFSITANGSSTATVAAGQTASYAVSVTPSGGFSQTVTMSCSGAPAQSMCSLSPSSLALNGSTPAVVNVKVTTAGGSAGLTQPFGRLPYGGTPAWLPLCGTLVLMVLVSLANWLRDRRPQIVYGLAFLCVLSLGVILSACGGSGASGGANGGTPAGTYNLTVTGNFTSGPTTLTHTTKLTLVVQ